MWTGHPFVGFTGGGPNKATATPNSGGPNKASANPNKKRCFEGVLRRGVLKGFYEEGRGIRKGVLKGFYEEVFRSGVLKGVLQGCFEVCDSKLDCRAKWVLETTYRSMSCLRGWLERLIP